MFSKLPNEILEIICSHLNVKEERTLGLFFKNVEHVRKNNLMRRAENILSTEPVIFHNLLQCIIESEKTGLAILQNEPCKNILLTQKPKALPHWILGIGECQPHLLEFIMEDEEYRNSLTKEETQYVITNFAKLLPPELVATILEELLNKYDAPSELLFDEENEIYPSQPLA